MFFPTTSARAAARTAAQIFVNDTLSVAPSVDKLSPPHRVIYYSGMLQYSPVPARVVLIRLPELRIKFARGAEATAQIPSVPLPFVVPLQKS